MPSVATDETARLAALRRYRILDTEPERAFDDLTLLASQICGTPIALITLVDAHRQWFKSRVGVSLTETSRAISFCTHAICQRGVLIIPDASQDGRVSESPLVTNEPHIRFYAGAPLVTPEGEALGTLCVADCVSRTLSPEQIEALDALRRQVQGQLELRRNLLELQDALAARDGAEAAQAALIEQLRSSHEEVEKLSALIPFCSKTQFEMTIPADPTAIPTITDGVTQLLHAKHWSESDIMAVELALQEAVANAIRHGCGNDATKSVQCCVTFDDRGEILIVVRDPGTGFDPGAIPDPLAPANQLKSSGRGIFLINNLMDEVGFAAGGSELQMRKKKAAS
jgi:anti-sigma regulatory factor (Ser/Thr protein kinase)